MGLMVCYVVIYNQTEHEKTKNTACDLLANEQPLDTTRVVNPHPFLNTIVPHSDCDVRVYLVVYVHSSLGHHQHRFAIRKTWGNVSQYGVPVRVVFVVGQRPREVLPSYEALVQEEVRSYGDLLQSNFLDTYRNLTRKAVAGLKWVTEHCRSAKYVLKTDDDTFVNLYLLLRLLNLQTKHGKYGKNVLVCNVCKTPVSRVGKWKATIEECSIDEYPRFCQGIAFVMTIDVAITLYNASNYVPLLWMDDVYITGFLPALLPAGTVDTINAESFYMSTWNIDNTTSREVLTGPDVYRFIYYPEDDLSLYDVTWRRLSTIVLGTEFKKYVDTLLGEKMRMKRKRLKNVPWKYLPWTYFFTDFIFDFFTD